MPTMNRVEWPCARVTSASFREALGNEKESPLVVYERLILLTSDAGFMLTSAFDVINNLLSPRFPLFLRRYQRIVLLNCA